jgi:hypothetical protein
MQAQVGEVCVYDPTDTAERSKQMDEKKIVPAAQEFKAVPVNSLRDAALKDATIVGRPADDDYCPAYWCLKMKPDVLDFMSRVNPADLAILVDHGFIKVSEFSKELQASIGKFLDKAKPDPEECPGHWCIRMRPGFNNFLDKVDPADLAVLVKHGVVQESALSAAQKADLQAIRIKK